MKKLLLAFIIISCSHLFSQVVFCPAGAEWAYNFKYSMGGAPVAPTVLEKIIYSGDSVINNDTVKVLKHKWFHLECSWLPIHITLIKQVGDTIFMRNYATNHNWQLLYNYNAQAGQSWQTTVRVDEHATSGPAYNTFTVTVDSVRTVSENGFNLRRLHVKYKHQYISYQTLLTWSSPAVITERFGCSKFMFNYYNNSFFRCDHDHFQRFLCYSDTEFGNSQFTEYACDYTHNPLTASITENYRKQTLLKFYPNPVQDMLYFEKINELDSKNISFYITNLIGEKITEHQLVSESPFKLDISVMNSGLYFINVSANGVHLTTEKFVKN